MLVYQRVNGFFPLFISEIFACHVLVTEGFICSLACGLPPGGGTARSRLFDAMERYNKVLGNFAETVVQDGAAPVISWFISIITPINYRYIRHKPQLSHL